MKLYEFADVICECVEAIGENFINIVLQIVSWICCAALFVTAPLWVIPYKVWKGKKKGGAE